MPRVPWSKVAKVIMERYLDNNKCRLCGAEIEQAENAFKKLSNVYKHFKENHPDIIEQVRTELA